jgi:ABC transport system ATP-binding/permease protein
MSEEILKALMQLFAILTKQDGGVEEDEKNYVRNFLLQQMGDMHVDEYYTLFLDTSFAETQEADAASAPKLTSVLDSVKILVICKKINKTLNQSQKVVVLIRLLELISIASKPTKQRMAIIDTVSQVFRIPKEESKSIETFVISNDSGKTEDPHILIASASADEIKTRHIETEKLEGHIVFLRVPDVNMYFFKYTGHEDIYLNGLGISSGRIYHFSRGGTIKLPRDKPIYYSDVVGQFLSALSTQTINLHVENLHYRFKNGTVGLKNINFTARQGNLFGIMGASGAGKTTLLNVLAGIEKPRSGKILINGMDFTHDAQELNGLIGYVPQDDLLIEELSVFENLYYNARLCFGNLSLEEITERVNAILFNLGLEGKRDLKVGNSFNKTISGGQRKRLNIALELIREPSILYVDEPTSGLSSKDSENVMDLLRELTMKGKLIFAVIHQPSSEIFKMFDSVIILDSGGHMAYCGNPVEAIMYFKRIDAQINSGIGECSMCGNVNPELIFNILEARVVDEYGNYTATRKVSPEKWEEFYQREQPSPEIPTVSQPPVKTLRLPGWLKQFKIFTIRDLLSKVSNKPYLILTLLEAPVLAFILSYIIRYVSDPSSNNYIFRENENIPIYIFMTLIVALFLGLTVSAEEIFRDRKILKREKILKLSTSGYLSSKVAILTLISAVQAITFVLLANNILEIREMTFWYWLAFFSTAVCANLIGLNISTSFNSAVAIYITIPLIMIPMMILSGAMFSFDKLNRNISRVDKVPLLAEIMPTKWSYEALMVKQFKDNGFETSFYELNKLITNSDFQLSYYIPDLEERLDRCLNDYKNKGSLQASENDFKTIMNEIKKESEKNQLPYPFAENNTNLASFNSETAVLITKFLEELRAFYLQVFTENDKLKTNRINYLMKNKKDVYFSMLDKHFNESVSDHVRKVWEKNKLVNYRNNLVRMSDPVFLDPPPSNPGIRSHFFAPRKYFMGKYYDTYAFNISMIWVLTGVLFGVLYMRRK